MAAPGKRPAERVALWPWGFPKCENAPNRDPTPKWFTALILFGNHGMQRGHVSREA